MKLKLLLDDIIAKDKVKIKIDYAVNRTKHGKERQDRHIDNGGKRISEKEISNVVKKAIPKMSIALMQDDIDINKDKVLIQSSKNLNIVGIITPGGEGPSSFNFKIITVMRTDHWKPNTDTKLTIKVK